MRLHPVTILLSSLVAVAPAVSLGGVETIRQDDMRRHVAFLAADELAGRDTGAPTIAIAERYVATAFESYGLEPLPGQDFTVPFALYRRGYDGAATGVQVGETRCVAGRDCRPFPFSATGRVEAPVVFAGYGIQAPDQGRDDYRGLDVRGKIVLLLRHGPGEGDPDKAVEGNHQQFSVKARRAREEGAVGMLLATDPLNHEDSDDFRIGGRLTREARPDGGERDDDDDNAFLAVHVSSAFARTLIQGSGKTLEELQQALDAGTETKNLSIGSPVARMSVVETEEPLPIDARNVVGILPGNDPALRDEWVVIGAHHDHVGAYDGAGDTVFNGADDNASGVSGVLELAQAFASRERRPRRTMVFATFTAEEKGLHGSRALVDEFLPLDKLTFMLNLDMIGRNSTEKVQLFGDGYVRDLRPLVERANAEQEVDLEFAGQAHAANSDHDAFYREGVPFMFLFTGTHEDYHQIGDHASKLDYPRMQEIMRLAYRVLDGWDELDHPLAFIHRIPWLGIGVEARQAEGSQVAEVTAVDEGSRGAEAGLRVGDRLVRIASRVVEQPTRIGTYFEDVAPESRVELAWTRSGRAQTAEVLRVRPGYMGVAPADVDAATRTEHGLEEDEGLYLNRVIPGGPSATAGLLRGDIVLRMAGRPVNGRTLTSRLARIGAGVEVPLTVLRDGESIEVLLTTGERPRR